MEKECWSTITQNRWKIPKNVIKAYIHSLKLYLSMFPSEEIQKFQLDEILEYLKKEDIENRIIDNKRAKLFVQEAYKKRCSSKTTKMLLTSDELFKTVTSGEKCRKCHSTDTFYMALQTSLGLDEDTNYIYNCNSCHFRWKI